MYTQCPHCSTLFRVRAEQLSAAHGWVRCCRCRGAFDALENLGEAAVDDATAAPPKPEPATHRDKNLPFEVPENLPDIAAASGYDHDLPIATKPPAAGRVAWNLGVATLTGLLILQVAWINRESLAGHPQGRYLLEKFCSLAQCSVPAHKAPERIRILSREVEALPDQDDTYQVRLVIANDAPFAQPYPHLQIEFFTGDAKLLAQRRFTPGEYLPDDVQSGVLMAPGQTARIQLDLADPGQPVTGYRFGFAGH